jgi:antitoxin VapB
LIGTDDRIRQFRHAPPTDDAVLRQYGMVNVCARRWGLVIAATRFVYFGPIPEELQAKLQVACAVNASMQNATRPGITSGELLEKAKKFYASNDYPDEWRLHHQGGAIGYAERDWVILPGGTQKVVDRQAFAYNPTVQGTKTEDTVLLIDGKIENLTRTGKWPEITSSIGGQTYTSPAILVLSK